MAPKRKPAKKRQPKKKPAVKDLPPQATQDTGSQSPGTVIFGSHGTDYNNWETFEPKDLKTTAARFNLLWTTGKPPQRKTHASTLLQGKISEYYNSEEQQEKERQECEDRGLATDGDGVTLRKRRFESETNGDLPEGNGREKRSRGSRAPSESNLPADFTKEEISSFLKRRELAEEGTDCERRLRLLVSELEYLREHCKTEWDILFFGHKSVKDIQKEAKQKSDAWKRKVVTGIHVVAEAELLEQDVLVISSNAEEEPNWTRQFRQQDVVADGNCLFRAFAAVYWGTEHAHSEVRQHVAELWTSVSSNRPGTGNPAADVRHELYRELQRQSRADQLSSGRVHSRNASLDQQISQFGYWPSHEMLQLIADVYDVEIVVHRPIIDSAGSFFGRWAQTVRGSNQEGRRRRQYHLATYPSTGHYTALFPVRADGYHENLYLPEETSRFDLHERPGSYINRPLDPDMLDQYAPVPRDLLYDDNVTSEMAALQPRWLDRYPQGANEENCPDNEEEEEGTDGDDGGDDANNGDDGDHDHNDDGYAGGNGYNAPGNNDDNDNDDEGHAGAAVQRERSRSRSRSSPHNRPAAPLNVAAHALPDPFTSRRPSTSPKSPRGPGGLFGPAAHEKRAGKFANQSPYDARFSAPHSRLPPKSPKSRAQFLRSPTDMYLERKAIRGAGRAPDYRTGVPDYGRPLGVRTMPFGMYGGWEEYEPGHEYYPRVAPDARNEAPAYDDYAQVARRRIGPEAPRAGSDQGIRGDPSFSYKRPQRRLPRAIS